MPISVEKFSSPPTQRATAEKIALLLKRYPGLAFTLDEIIGKMSPGKRPMVLQLEMLVNPSIREWWEECITTYGSDLGIVTAMHRGVIPYYFYRP